MHIRRAELDDAEGIAAIYNHEAVERLTVFDLRARTLEEQRQWLLERSGAHSVIVAEEDGGIVGFASLSPFRSRPAYNTTVECSVFVRRDHIRQGIGKALLTRLVGLASEHGFCYVGYWIDQSQAGQSYAPEALAAVLRFGFEECLLYRMQVAIVPTNSASLRVVEKLGIPTEGIARKFLEINGTWEDHQLFAMTIEDWEQHGGALVSQWLEPA